MDQKKCNECNKMGYISKHGFCATCHIKKKICFLWEKTRLFIDEDDYNNNLYKFIKDTTCHIIHYPVTKNNRIGKQSQDAHE